MLKWAVIFAVIAMVAGLFGFTGIAAGAAGIALPIGIECGSARRGMAKCGRRVGTGRVDPLPRFGHGASMSVMPSVGRRGRRRATKKARSVWERAG